LKGIEQLQTGFTHLIRILAELLRVLNCESDPIDRDPRLIGHFELDSRRRRIRCILDGLKNLMHHI
jgi:hypothetical protein